ncbi:hypothetical protein H0X06_01685 [Candidatus Dependentiae bacterium]|nr:hypothetical protein [Candidatus Dependentiae bacterium]
MGHINLYPNAPGEDWIEFDSIINIRPSCGTRIRGVDDINVQIIIRTIVSSLVEK